jgi:endogenous inhibitor of DNA gyrase (YacG/DUF329 family)
MPGKVKCPICGREVALDDTNMPFCSDRCRLLDLGNWASEKYVISTPAQKGNEFDELESSADPDRFESPKQ